MKKKNSSAEGDTRVGSRHKAGYPERAHRQPLSVEQGDGSVRVYRPTPTSAIARPARRKEPARPKPMTKERALDLMVAGLFALARQVRAQERALAGDGAHYVEHRLLNELALVDLTRGEGGENDRGVWTSATGLLELMTACHLDVDFPYPGSPRYGDAPGGGHKVAPDGSPGIPASWVRWMARPPRGMLAGSELAMPHAPLVLAVAWLARHEPALWRVYADLAIGGLSVRDISQRHSTPERPMPLRKVYRARDKAHALLLTLVAFFTGDATTDEYREMLALVLGDHFEPPLDDSDDDATEAPAIRAATASV